jgi:hypothetical protein
MTGVTEWNDEQCAQLLFADLDIRHYPGKWRQAQRLTRHDHPELRGKAWWRRVRLTFLELGGGRREQHDRKRSGEWHSGVG